MSNYLVYPTKFMNITQGYLGAFSHAGNAGGNPKDYPIDEACGGSGRDYIYCPCNEMQIVRLYGVGNGGTNTVWLTSTSKVEMPCGFDYVTMMVMHPNDDDLSKLEKGQKFKRGEEMFREGADGWATGNHLHIAFGKGEISGNGWTQNTKSTWVLSTTNGTIKPEEACYIDNTFTKVINTQNIAFKSLPSSEGEIIDMNNMRGIDVSSHNGSINWTKVKSDNIDFVMIRAGFGTEESQIDKRFKSNVENALAAGLHVGCYWFSYAINIEEVKQEAALFNKVLTPYKGKLTFPMCYDFEYDSVNYAKKHGVHINKKIATEFAIVFCREMEKYGWYAMNYLNLDYHINYFDADKLKSVDTWYANWSVAKPDISCGMWQYASTGKVNGMIGDVDMNISYNNYPVIIKNAKLNGFIDEEIPELPNEDAGTPEEIDYKKLYQQEVEYSNQLIKRNEELSIRLDQFKKEIRKILDLT